MSGDVSGNVPGDSGQVKFHLAGFPAGQSYLGGKSLADVILHEFEMIMRKFQASLEGNLGNLKKLHQLATTLLKLSQVLNSITTGAESPSKIAAEIKSTVAQVRKEINGMFPPSKRQGVYYKTLMASLKSVEGLLKGGQIAILEKLGKDERALYNWFDKQYERHGHKGYISNHQERDALAKELKKLLSSVDGDLTQLKTLLDNWNSDVMGPKPHELDEIYSKGEAYWKALMHIRVSAGFHRDGDLSQFWHASNGELGWWLAALLYVGRYHGDMGSRWHRAEHYQITGVNQMFRDGYKAIDYTLHHVDALTSHAVIGIIQAMGENTNEGIRLRRELPGIWEEYQQALRSVNQMQAQVTSLGNEEVSNIYSKSTALQQITKTLSKDLEVPIQAVDQSIARILR